MIPKRIIYCWFGDKEMPQKVKDCMESWEINEGWELLRIDETNFDINYNEYVKEAYRLKKYAFVSDVARLWALYNYGGIYLDTDVIVYKPLNKFLSYDFFTGFEQYNYPVTATMGAKKGDSLIKEMLKVYNTKKFELKDKWEDYETNTMIMSDIIGKYFDRESMKYQEKDNRAIFPKEVFCNSGNEEERYTEHLMLGDWGLDKE